MADDRTYTLALYNYTDKNGRERGIIVRERTWDVMGGKIVDIFDGTADYRDASHIHYFTPDYVKKMSAQERLTRFNCGPKEHTHTLVYDLENKGYRTLIRKNQGGVSRKKYPIAHDLDLAVKDFREMWTPWPELPECWRIAYERKIANHRDTIQQLEERVTELEGELESRMNELTRIRSQILNIITDKLD